MERLERLINLTATLLDARRPLSREEIVELVPGYPSDDRASRRAFERDKEALRSMGIPITVGPLDASYPELGTGYRILRHQYQLLDPGLTGEELAALHLAASAVRLEGVEGAEALWKLGGTVPPDDASPPAAPVAALALPGSEHLAALFGAVSERRTVRFGYRGEPRILDPWRLYFRGGHWYVAGHDHDRQGERSFRLDRLTSSPQAELPNGFARPRRAPPAPPSPWEMGDDEPLAARLWVDADQAEWAVAYVGQGAVAERHPGGAVILELAVRNRAAFRSFVLGFLDHAEVLAPPALRQETMAWLRAFCPA